jgi:hypothetical protein
MASYRAIGAACEAIIRLLQQSWQPAIFDDAPLHFQVYGTDDFEERPVQTGVSLFLYRVAVSPIQRTSPGKPKPNGKLRRQQLPLELYFILTPWAQAPSLQQEILGWMMRTIEDTPILSAGILNTLLPDVFAAEETVEIVHGQLTNEEMFRIWDVLPGDYRISVPYLARTVRIDSELEVPEAKPVLTKELEFAAFATNSTNDTN